MKEKIVSLVKSVMSKVKSALNRAVEAVKSLLSRHSKIEEVSITVDWSGFRDLGNDGYFDLPKAAEDICKANELKKRKAKVRKSKAAVNRLNGLIYVDHPQKNRTKNEKLRPKSKKKARK